MKNQAMSDDMDNVGDNEGDSQDRNPKKRLRLRDGPVPVHLILIIIGCLILLLSIIGFVSYYRAMKS